MFDASTRESDSGVVLLAIGFCLTILFLAGLLFGWVVINLEAAAPVLPLL